MGLGIPPPDLPISRTDFLAHELDDAWHDRQHDNAEDEQREVPLHERDVAEIIAAEHEKPDPERTARKTVEQKPRVGHAANAGNERREGAHDRQEAREDHGLAAELFVKAMRALEVRRMSL